MKCHLDLVVSYDGISGLIALVNANRKTTIHLFETPGTKGSAILAEGSIFTESVFDALKFYDVI